MYRAYALLKEPFADQAAAENFVNTIATQNGFVYGGISIGEYGSTKEGFTPVYCMSVIAEGYTFVLYYNDGLGSFTSNKLDGFKREDYSALMQITGKESDPLMDHFNDFMMLCGSIERQIECLLINFNRDSGYWEKM